MFKFGENNPVFAVFTSIFVALSYIVTTIILNSCIKFLGFSKLDTRISLISTFAVGILSYLLVLGVVRITLGKLYLTDKKIEFNPLSYLGVVMTALFLQICTSLFFVIFADMFPLSETEANFYKLFELEPLFPLIQALIVAPIFEEILFRRTILSYLSKTMKESHAIIISSILFGAFHMNTRQFLLATVLGSVLGYIYVKSGKFKLVVALHFLYNVFGILMPSVILKIYSDFPSLPLYYYVGFAGVTVLSAFSFLQLLKKLREQR